MSLCLEHALIVNYIASAQSCHYHYSYWQLSLLSDLMLYALCWWKITNLAACCDALCIYLQLIVWTVNVASFTVPNEGSWRLLLCRLNSSLIISSISLLHIWIHCFEGSKLFAELEIKSVEWCKTCRNYLSCFQITSLHLYLCIHRTCTILVYIIHPGCYPHQKTVVKLLLKLFIKIFNVKTNVTLFICNNHTNNEFGILIIVTNSDINTGSLEGVFVNMHYMGRMLTRCTL